MGPQICTPYTQKLTTTLLSFLSFMITLFNYFNIVFPCGKHLHIVLLHVVIYILSVLLLFCYYQKLEFCSSWLTLAIIYIIYSMGQPLAEYANEVIHMGNTCVHLYPHTKFCHCSPYRTLVICLFLVFSQSE